MMMRKGWLCGCVGSMLVLAAGSSVASADDVQASQRDAYVKSAGRTVAGIPPTAVISSVDPLGDHRIALYTVDGPHKDIWLVTTDDACATPMLSGTRIVSNSGGVEHACRSVAVRTVNQHDLTARLMPLGHDRPVMDADTRPDTVALRWDTVFQSAAMTDNGRTR